MSFITQAGQEKSIAVDWLCSAMNISRATYYRHLEGQGKTGSVRSPVNALTDLQKQSVLDLLHSDIC